VRGWVRVLGATSAMSAYTMVAAELEDAITNGSSQKRVEALRRITDLFVNGAEQFSDEQVALFDQVIARLADEIEARARVELADRLAHVANAPTNVIISLANDDTIEAASPVLAYSSRLDDQVLVGIAKTKSQHHLLAISQRETISEPVTDVLVTRGDLHVLRSVAQNIGARFSDNGFGVLVARAQKDDVLATHVGLRQDIPRHHMTRLIEKASEAARRKLAAVSPVAAAEVRRILEEIAARMKAEAAPPKRNYAAAKALVADMRKLTQVGEKEIRVFAQSGKFEETVVALAVMTKMPNEAVEAIFEHEKSDMCLVLARAAGLSWPTTKLLLIMQSGRAGVSDQDAEIAKDNFEKLQPATAQRVVRFYQARKTVGNA
jgi:uncharacterized protein (DUF2336 family)